MLPCVCSVIDHRWRQNVVRTKKWHTRRSRVCHWCSYHILMSSVICYWTDARQRGIYLFYIIKKLKYMEKMPFFFKFRHFERYENSTDMIKCLYKMKQTDWLLCLAKNCDWFKFKIKKIQKFWIERCRHLCVCPLIDQRREPIRMRE